MKLFIISGRSGAGKSIALQSLEDLGYFCIDNFPLGLLISLVNYEKSRCDNLAISIDARNLPEDLQHFPAMMAQLKTLDIDYQVLFFDADDDALLQRFNATRRKHPLTNENISLNEALAREKALLNDIMDEATLSIDTTKTTVHQLRDIMCNQIAKHKSSTLSLQFQSFGHKYGAPKDVDFLFDVRCLPNPFWESELSGYTGLDQPTIDFLERQPKVEVMIKDIISFLENWIPHFEASNRSYLTVGIGCTGGQHRSVYIAQRLAKHFSARREHVQVRHREL